MVESVLKGDRVPDEIIIVDQSDQPNPDLAFYPPTRNCEVRYFPVDWTGVSRGRNLAIREARGEILVLTDDDTLAPGEWFGEIVCGLLKAGRKSIVTGRVDESLPEKEGAVAPSVIRDLAPAIYTGQIEKDVLYTNNMAAFKTAFAEVGMFDERLGPGTPYPAAEDNDLAFRFLKAGYQIVYEPRAAIIHRAWRTHQENLKVEWNYGYGQGAFYAKYILQRNAFMLNRLLKDLFNYTVRLPFFIIRKPHQARSNAAFALALVFGALRWMRTYWSAAS
jgi:GT2 family glycosyltransferase